MREHKNRIISLIIILSFIVALPLQIIVNADTNGKQELNEQELIERIKRQDVIPDEIIVAFKDDVLYEEKLSTLLSVCSEFYPNDSQEDLLSRVRCDKRFSLSKLYVESEDAIEIILNLKDKNVVKYADFDYRVEVCDDFDPNANLFSISELEYDFDPGQSSVSSYGQWHLDKINVMGAWDQHFTGDSSTKIAVLDTGYSAHTQLYDNVDLSLAYNVVEDTTDVTDDMGHGTFIAGLIGAALDGVGTNGICQNIKIVPIEITYYDEDLDGYYASMYSMKAGIELADDIGASVINISFGLSTTGYNIIADAIENFGKLVVFAAGNSSSLMEDVEEDAGKANDDPLMVVVGASTINDGIRYTSNYSADYVDLFAPGENIISTNNNNYYRIWHGTSFAAPMVTAAIALIASHATHLSPVQIKNYIFDNVTVPSGNNAFYQKCKYNGYLNVSAAVMAIYNEYRGAYSRGDGNGDGYIDAADYFIARRIALGTYTPTQQQLAALDVDGDGVVAISDYILIQRYTLRTYYFVP